MKLYLISKKNSISATGEYNPATKQLTVLKGSRVSDFISYAEKFRGADSIKKSRTNTVKGRLVIKDITFKSASTAANFVTGNSTNGLITWKDKNGRTLKEITEDESK
jgi:hypothetical protein